VFYIQNLLLNITFVSDK